MAETFNDISRRCGVDADVVRRVLEACAGPAGTAAGDRAPVRNLGILYTDEGGRGLTHPFFVLILDAFRAEAQARGYDITFINRSVDEDGVDYPSHCRRLGVDGVCMVCMDFTHPRIKALAASDIPCVTVDHIFKGMPAVLSDNETGVQKLVEYAISRGHRRIAFIHGQNNSIVTRTRIAQFGNTMRYRDLPVPEGFIREGLYNDIPCTRRLVTELLRQPERPTCILLPDDMAYLGAQDAAREMGMRIPEDISFAGYDGIPMTQALTPRLTTIRQSCDSMGREAARRLIDLIEHPDTAPRKPSVFPVELVEGGTVGPARG